MYIYIHIHTHRYASEMLRVVIASDRKAGRDVKSKNPDVIAFVNAFVVKDGNADDGDDKTISNLELLEFCKKVTSSLPQRMFVLYLRISRLGNVQSDSGMSLDVFSRCVEAALDPSFLEDQLST